MYRARAGEEAAAPWQHYLRGLWTSGLRLTESLDLHWDREDRLFPVFPRGGRPMLRVPAELEKGNADRLLPIAPEFGLFLLETPEGERTGPVFKLNGRVGPLKPNEVSKIVAAIGVGDDAELGGNADAEFQNRAGRIAIEEAVSDGFSIRRDPLAGRIGEEVKALV